jgi:hypothetical protein
MSGATGWHPRTQRAARHHIGIRCLQNLIGGAAGDGRYATVATS